MTSYFEIHILRQQGCSPPRGFFQLSEEDPINFFCIKWSIADTHKNIACVALPTNPDQLIIHPQAELRHPAALSHQDRSPSSPFCLALHKELVSIHQSTPVIWVIPPHLHDPKEIIALFVPHASCIFVQELCAVSEEACGWLWYWGKNSLHLYSLRMPFGRTVSLSWETKLLELPQSTVKD